MLWSIGFNINFPKSAGVALKSGRNGSCVSVRGCPRIAAAMSAFRNTRSSGNLQAHPEFAAALKARALPAMKRLVTNGAQPWRRDHLHGHRGIDEDGRDRSLDHKLSNILVPKGSRLAAVMDDVAPAADDIVLPKTSSGVFNTTNIRLRAAQSRDREYCRHWFCNGPVHRHGDPGWRGSWLLHDMRGRRVCRL